MTKTSTKKSAKATAARDCDQGAMLLRFRQRDTPAGVTRKTVTMASQKLGVSETQFVHLALREYVRSTCPSVDVDAPAITKKDIQRLRDKYPQTGHGRVLSSID